MPFATALPRCPVRPANPLRRHLLAVWMIVVVLAPAWTLASDSQVRFVDPACRLQPRQLNETATFSQTGASANTADRQRDIPQPRAADTTVGGPTNPESAAVLQQALARCWSGLGEIQLSAMIRPQVEFSKAPWHPATDTHSPQPRLAQRSFPSEEAGDVPMEPIPSPAAAAEPEPLPCYRARSLSEIEIDISLPTGDVPVDATLECAATTPLIADPRLTGSWTMSEFHWSATGVCHRPLYFEEVNAERYGYTPSYFFQPVISAGRFFLTIPALPYKMVVERPHDCIYTLGHYRPGTDGVPRRWHRLPWHITAATVEVGVIAGLILLIP